MIIQQWVKSFAIFWLYVTHNLAAPYAFFRDHTELWDAALAWYSPIATRQFTSVAWETVTESTVLSLLDLTRLLRLLQPRRKFWNYVVTVLWSPAPSPFVQQIDYDTLKSPGDPRRLAVTQTSVNKTSSTTGVKSSQETEWYHTNMIYKMISY